MGSDDERGDRWPSCRWMNVFVFLLLFCVCVCVCVRFEDVTVITTVLRAARKTEGATYSKVRVFTNSDKHCRQSETTVHLLVKIIPFFFPK